jgi:hypothetical protein
MTVSVANETKAIARVIAPMRFGRNAKGASAAVHHRPGMRTTPMKGNTHRIRGAEESVDVGVVMDSVTVALV